MCAVFSALINQVEMVSQEGVVMNLNHVFKATNGVTQGALNDCIGLFGRLE